MTTDAGGYQPPSTGGSSGYPPINERQSSTGAKEAVAQVGSTAGEQAKNVAGEAKAQARNLVNEVGTQANEQARTQQSKAAQGLRSLSGELRSMADGGQSGMASDLARQASQRSQDLASWLEARDPGQIVEEVRSLARRKPGAFLVGCALAGVVAGRLTRGTVAAQQEGSGSNGEGTSGAPYAGHDPSVDRTTVAVSDPLTDPLPSDFHDQDGVGLRDPLTEPVTLEPEPQTTGLGTGDRR